MIGVPTNLIYMNEGGHLHHNSMDTIDKVDPRSLRELSFLNASYLYYIANAGYEEVPWIANLTFNRGIRVILEIVAAANENLLSADNGTTIGIALSGGLERIRYYTELQKKALESILRIVPPEKKDEVRKLISPYKRTFDDFEKSQTKQLEDVAKARAGAASVKIVKLSKKESAWEKQATSIIPKRNYFATLFLAEIPVEEWREIKSTPRWWSATNWASASYWWCNGKRNLNEIKKLCELEAGRPVIGFDLINYYNFLKKYGYVEFVNSTK